MFPIKRQPSILLHVLLLLALSACGITTTSPSPPATPVPQPISQTPGGGQPPVVLRVVERKEVIDGFLYVYDDIYFTDLNGDAVAMTYNMVSSSLPYPLNLTDDPIEASAGQQKGEALFTVAGWCWQKLELAFESRIVDRAGNVSAPVLITLSCPAPLPVDTAPYLRSGLTTGLPVAAILLLGYWPLFRRRPGERSAALRSMLLIVCLVLVVNLIHFILHEGGHSLYLLASGVPITLYVHPFLFSGFSRPLIDYGNVLTHILGSATALPIAALVTLPLWKRRSLALLPLVLLFPFAALTDGINVMGLGGDFMNLVQITGIPAITFLVLGSAILLVGIISFMALLPLAGLDPSDRKSLFALPAAMFAWAALSLIVAVIVVPGSPIHAEYFLGPEIMASAVSILPTTLIGVALAVLYVTLFRWIQPKLPAWLRAETAEVTWKDLRVPALLAAVSIAIGLMVIT